MPENDLDCNKSTCSTEKSHSENFRILCPSLHKIKQFSFYIFISYHLLIHNTWWVLILKRTQRNYKTVLSYWFLCKCSKVDMAYLFIRVLKIHVSEFHWFIKIKHSPSNIILEINHGVSSIQMLKSFFFNGKIPTTSIISPKISPMMISFFIDFQLRQIKRFERTGHKEMYLITNKYCKIM